MATTTALNVLLVEDDDGDALLVEEELSLAGSPHSVTRVRTIAEACAVIGQEPDCVLLDLGLPDSVGLDGLGELQRRSEAAFVVLTGLADEQQGVAALSAGAQDYLVKGAVDGAGLLRAIRYAVERRGAERSAAALREAELAARENIRLERGLLPSPILHHPRVRISTAYRAGRRSALLGGDFFDVVEAADGRIHVVIGDVSGHSADEAALGAALRIAWRTLIFNESHDEGVLPTMDRVLTCERHSEEIFATAVTLAISDDLRRADVRLAGHPAPLLLTEGATAPMQAAPQAPLGSGLTETWAATAVDLPPTWSMLLYTDGLYEGHDGEERLGMTGLRRLLDAGMPPGGLQSLIAEVERRNGGPLSDDVATLLLTACADA